MQQQRAQAMGGTASYDLNGDGTIGPGESMTTDPRQSMQGRFQTAQMGALNRGGLASSTLGAGKSAMYSKNLNDQLFQAQAGQEQRAAQGQADLSAQMATLGNQAGTSFAIGPDGKIINTAPAKASPVAAETAPTSVLDFARKLFDKNKFTAGV
jgi:hypothetical protein